MSSYTLLSLIPFVLIALAIVGLVLITLGIRGRPVFSSPHCGKCGYDLRNMQFMTPETLGNCPECGLDLTKPGAVSFGKWRRQPKRIIGGVAMIVLPWVVTVPLVTAANRARMRTMPGPTGAALKSNAALLASLKTTIDSPWDWQELERRMKAGTLPQADVDAAFGVLINDLNAKRAAGRPRQPLHWADRFLTPAIQANAVSQKQVLALAQAYYGMAPTFTIRSRARQDEAIALTLNQHEPWQLPNMQQCWALTDITADGTTQLTPQLRHPPGGIGRDQPHPPAKPDQLSGRGRDGQFEVLVPQSLPPGEHEIAFTFELGVVPENMTMRGLDGKPGTPDKWPSPIARWKSVVKRTLTIHPKEQSPVTLVTDPALNPFGAASLTVEEAMARPSSRGVDLVIKYKFSGVFSLPVAYRVTLQAGDQKIDQGALVTGKTSSGTATHTSHATVKALAPDVRTLDVLLTPDTAAAERHTEIEEIWGKPHRIKNVPLQRFDLADDGPPGDTAGADGKLPASQGR